MDDAPCNDHECASALMHWPRLGLCELGLALRHDLLGDLEVSEVGEVGCGRYKVGGRR